MPSDARTPSTFDLRVFAGLLSPFVALLAAGIGRWSGIERLWLWVAAAVLPLSIVGLIWPTAILGLYRGWMRLTAPIGRFLSILLLSGIYFLVFTPMGLVLRLFGIDPAQRRWISKASTYWMDRPARPDESYFHPY